MKIDLDAETKGELMKVSYNPGTNTFEPSRKDSLLPQIMWHITDHCHLNFKTCFTKERKLRGPRKNCAQMLQNLPMLKQLGVQKIDLSGIQTAVG